MFLVLVLTATVATGHTLPVADLEPYSRFAPSSRGERDHIRPMQL